MTNEELVKIDTQNLTEENARVLGIDLLKGDIDQDKAAAKRQGLVAAVLTAGVVATGMDNVASFALMGADATFLFQLFQKINAIYQKKKTLKQFEEKSYQESYVDFIKVCQDYITKQHTDKNERTR